MKNLGRLRFAAIAAGLCLLCGCPPKQAARRPPQRAGAAPAKSGIERPNPEAQKKAYERGLKHFSDENYLEAKKAWEEAIRFGRSTPLGLKAQEYLQKTNQTLKTLREIEQQ